MEKLQVEQAGDNAGTHLEPGSQLLSPLGLPALAFLGQGARRRGDEVQTPALLPPSGVVSGSPVTPLSLHFLTVKVGGI